jgi:hypothetical protein
MYFKNLIMVVLNAFFYGNYGQVYKSYKKHDFPGCFAPLKKFRCKCSLLGGSGGKVGTNLILRVLILARGKILEQGSRPWERGW